MSLFSQTLREWCFGVAEPTHGALPGTHLCYDHQGNHSHYAERNCRICQLQDTVAELACELDPPPAEWAPNSHWDNHTSWPAEDWVSDVSDGNTRLDYISWVNQEIQSEYCLRKSVEMK